MNLYKIKDSLYIKGKKVISYETHVATIEGNKIIEKGKYSRTTSKHITFIADHLNLEIIRSNKDMRSTFYKFDIGCVDIKKENNAIDPKLSIEILKMLRKGIDYSIIVASLKNKISKRKWENLYKPKNLTKELQRGTNILSRLDII